MIITGLQLQNYRSYNSASFEFEDGVNIIVGPNTSGKTNLLEAILLIATGKSYRSSDEQLINNNSDWGRLEATTKKNNTRIIRLQNNHQTKPLKTFEIDDKKYTRLPKNQHISIVLFEPNQLQFLTTQPEHRRNLFDDLLEQTDSSFTSLKRDYLKTLKQRNSLLKKPPSIINTQIFAWNIRLSELAGQIVSKRQSLIETVNHDISSIYSDLAGNNNSIKLSYLSKINHSNYANNMNKQLEERLDTDIERGFTGVGPHRDDIKITIDSADIIDNASRGEVRTLLLAFKVKSSILLEEVNKHKPLLLFDDVFGELDGSRRKALTNYLKGHQTFITTTDADVVGKKFTQTAQQILL